MPSFCSIFLQSWYLKIQRKRLPGREVFISTSMDDLIAPTIALLFITEYNTWPYSFIHVFNTHFSIRNLPINYLYLLREGHPSKLLQIHVLDIENWLQKRCLATRAVVVSELNRMRLITDVFGSRIKGARYRLFWRSINVDIAPVLSISRRFWFVNLYPHSSFLCLYPPLAIFRIIDVYAAFSRSFWAVHT